jgi:hypothetical protein
MLRKLTIVLVLAAAAAYFFVIAEPESSGGLVLYDPSAEAEGELVTAEVEVPLSEQRKALAPRRDVQPVKVSGRVVRTDGSPVGDVEVVQKHPYLVATPVRSASDGSFTLEVEEPRGELAVGNGPWLLLGGERFLAAGHPDGYFLVVAQARSLSGRVTDSRGAALRGVEVRATAPTDALVPLRIVSPPMFDERQSALSDERGAFEIDAPNMPGSRIQAALVGYQTLEEPLSAVAAGELVLVLTAH